MYGNEFFIFMVL